MKKLFTVIAIILIAVPAFSQGKSRWGVIGGFTSASTNLKEIGGKNFAGFHAGLTAYHPLGLGFAIQPSLIYQQKGMNLQPELYAIIGTSSSYAENSDITLNGRIGYVQIPVQLQFGIDLVILRPFVFVEPFIGYAVHNSFSVDTPVIDITPVKNEWEGINRFEYGLGVGGGLDITRHFQLSVKYYWNFNSNFDNKVLPEIIKNVAGAIKDKTQFNGLQVSAAILF